ncbi:MAG TPA: flavodoxin [Firmicutes bacterium]|nr:flavodoxin [Bacillota bacterium]
MKNKKRLLSCLLTGTMLLVLAACGQPSVPTTQSQDPQTPGSSETQPQESFQPETIETAIDGESGKTLVVYYSATGNTETVAGYIADALGADLFEITPAQPYTSDDLNWTDGNSRVSREHDDPSLRVVELTATTVEDWDSYDTVFIGYPIWWGIAAWPVDGFVSANDFTGKTVIPFCTSSSSGLGESGELLAELAGTGDWQDGQRFRGSVNQTDIVNWISELDFLK